VECSVVIRAYNEADRIGRLLEGIKRQSVQDVEVIVVDSGSKDATIAIAKNHGVKVVNIPSDEFSFGRSLNLGMAAAKHEYAVVASAHAYPVYPDWLECLLGPFEDRRVAMVYGKQRGAQTARFSEQQIFRQWFPDSDVRSQAGPFCNNANAAIRRRLWEKHPYDETLTGLEDIAWAKWAQGQGYEVAYSAHAEIVHVHNETARRVYDRYRREAMAFNRIFPEAHFSAYDFARLTAANVLSDLREAGRQGLLWQRPEWILWFRILQFWGTYQGYRHSSPVTQQLRQRFYYPGGLGAVKAEGRAVEPIRYDK
jgi:glycosyltransferase involved in cell wall biosynthesis